MADNEAIKTVEEDTPMTLQVLTTSCAENVIISKGSGRKELLNVLFLGFIFMMSFSTMQSLQNLQSSLNKESGLGVLSLASLYAVIIITGMFTPIVVRAVGTKWCFVLGWTAHCFYTAANFYPSWKTLLPASLFVGLTQSALWVSQAVYVSTRGLNYSKLTGRTIFLSLTTMNGSFYALYNLSMIIGNVISSLVLQITHQSLHDHTNSSEIHEIWIDQCGSDDCPGTNSTRSTNFSPSQTSVYILLGIFAAIGLCCLLLTSLFLQPLSQSPNVSFSRYLGSCYRLFWTDIKLYLLIPFTMSQSFVAVVVFAEFTKSYISCSLGVSMVGYIMAAYGVSSAALSAIQVRVAKYTGRRLLLCTAATCQLSMLLLMLWWKPDPKNLYVYFLVAFVFGAADGTWHPQAYSFIVVAFGNQRDAAFYNLNTWKAAGYAIQFLISPFLCVFTKVVFAASFLVAAMLLYAIVEVLLAKTERRASMKQTSKLLL